MPLGLLGRKKRATIIALKEVYKEKRVNETHTGDDNMAKKINQDYGVIFEAPAELGERRVKKNREKGIIYSKDILFQVEQHGFKLRYNEVLAQQEVNSEPITDAIYSRIISTMRAYGERLDINQYKQERIIEHALNEAKDEYRYNPISEYLAMCYEKFGTQPKDYFKELIDNTVFPSDTEKAWAEICLRYWFAGAIAKSENGFQNWMLVIKGSQGKGKSTLCKNLCKNIGMQYYQGGHIDVANKDHSIKRASVFVWEVEEIGSTMNNADMNKLKAFITQSHVKDRLPYAKFPCNMKVNANFIATTNDEAFLKDITGNRRYLVFEVIEIFQHYNENFDPDYLWGQAMMEYNLVKNNIGEVNMLPHHRGSQESRNEAWRDKSFIEGLLEEVITKKDDGFVSGEDIQMYLKGGQWNEVTMQDGQMSREINKAMEAMGFKRTRKDNKRGFSGCSWKRGHRPNLHQ